MTGERSLGYQRVPSLLARLVDAPMLAWLHKAMDSVDLVKSFLRAQNLEQLGKLDDATLLYEEALEAGFDSTGPYDRLIALYSDRARHRDVARVAAAALEHVHTHEDKRAWYERMRTEAERAAAKVPKAAKKRA